MVNYTQHAASKTVTQHVPELPGSLFETLPSIFFSVLSSECILLKTVQSISEDEPLL